MGVENGDKAEDTKAEEEPETVPRPEAEGLKRLHRSLAEEDEDGFTKDKFVNIVRLFMKVKNDTVITDVLNIKEGKNLRRLEAPEVVEVLEGPKMDAVAKVLRVRARAVKDEIE